MATEDYIFTNQHGQPYNVNHFGRIFKKIKDALGIKGEFRLLRHSGGTAFVEAGVENNTITIMTGHKNAKTFDQFYKGKSEKAAKNAYLKRAKK